MSSKTADLHHRNQRDAAQQATLIAGFRARLAGLPSPLDAVPPGQLARARHEFGQLPEIAGEPLPARARKTRLTAT